MKETEAIKLVTDLIVAVNELNHHWQDPEIHSKKVAEISREIIKHLTTEEG